MKRILIVLILMTGLLAARLPAAEAHEPKRIDCVKYSKMHALVVGSPAVERPAFLKCMERAASHRFEHCRGDYVRRNTCIIKLVFVGYEAAAVSVAWCESSLRTWASNGQYLGMFQMGSNERATYGHGPDARTQAEAAHRYFVASGRDWSPWECQP
jgi:hypothetical protein